MDSEQLSMDRLVEICLRGGQVTLQEVESMAWELLKLRRLTGCNQEAQPMHGQDNHG